MKTKSMKTLFGKSTSHSILFGLMGSFALAIIISLGFLTSSTFAKDIVLSPDEGSIDNAKIQYPSEDYSNVEGDAAVNSLGRSANTLRSNSVNAFPYTYVQGTTRSTTDIGNVLFQTNQEGSLLEKYLDLFGINYSNENGKAIAYVQVIINYVLALLGIIAVVLIMYSFYSIFLSSKSDDAITNARKTVVWASIGLILVALSAYIVNFIFYIYNKGL